MPAPEEIKELLKATCYSVLSIEKITDVETLIIISDDKNNDLNIYCYYSSDCISFNQALLKQALELTQIICGSFGPFYFGYNSFDRIFLVDEEVNINEMITLINKQ